VLRHKPEAIGLELDREGWASVDELLVCAARDGKQLTREKLQEIVEIDDKKRFSLSDDSELIRANQGHSLKIDLGLEPLEPPETLYHGTATRFLQSILREGLEPRNRHHVHLSGEQETAVKVGQRHGAPVVLRIAAQQMQAEGYSFYCSANGVWLVEEVPPAYLEVMG
jgi:putative RNA 2'-phosphotransferase